MTKVEQTATKRFTVEPTAFYDKHGRIVKNVHTVSLRVIGVEDAPRDVNLRLNDTMELKADFNFRVEQD